MTTHYAEWRAYVTTPIGERIQSCTCQTESGDAMRRRHAYSELPEMMRTKRFHSFLARTDYTEKQQASLKEIQAACQSYAYGKMDEPWLCLAGSKGWGKTHLISSIVNVRIDEPEFGNAAKFVEVPRMLQELRAGFEDGSYQARFDELMTAAVLVLDDLGAQRDTSWATEQIYILLDHRYLRGLPTVISTNVMPSEMDARVRDRILDRGSGICRVLAAQLPSYRTNKVVE